VQDKATDLRFKQPSLSGTDLFRTMESVVKIGNGQGLYLITHYGDRNEVFEKENRKAIEEPFIQDRSRYCSVFSAGTGDGFLVGRNWDNENVGAVIVNLYQPAVGYASISFSRAIDLGFGKYIELQHIQSPEIGKRLMLAPFYAMDGINERGLTVAVTGVKQTEVNPQTGKEPVFITFLIRKILDQTRTVPDAIHLAEQYVPFDLDQNSLNAHFFVADSAGNSVILEYTDDQWQTIYSDKSWQVLTTKPVFNVPDSLLREQCWRHKSISETLEKTHGQVNRQSAMQILQDVEQKGTTWSIVYSPPQKELHFSVYKQWEKVYHLALPRTGDTR
jgi:hypothetical protein